MSFSKQAKFHPKCHHFVENSKKRKHAHSTLANKQSHQQNLVIPTEPPLLKNDDTPRSFAYLAHKRPLPHKSLTMQTRPLCKHNLFFTLKQPHPERSSNQYATGPPFSIGKLTYEIVQVLLLSNRLSFFCNQQVAL